MPRRKIIFANDQIYHLINRGVAQQPIFKSQKDYHRALAVMEYYRHANPSLRYSHLVRLPQKIKALRLDLLEKKKDFLVEIIAFCLMPNHIHLLVKQLKKQGITTFMGNFQNSYARYFNTKYDRVGPLFQMVFKAVRIETDEQLLHVSRYIHLNPVSSYLIEVNKLTDYSWSSFPNYLGKKQFEFVNSKPILEHFSSKKDYKKFVFDQADYQMELQNIKHLTLEK